MEQSSRATLHPVSVQQLPASVPPGLYLKALDADVHARHVVASRRQQLVNRLIETGDTVKQLGAAFRTADRIGHGEDLLDALATAAQNALTLAKQIGNDAELAYERWEDQQQSALDAADSTYSPAAAASPSATAGATTPAPAVPPTAGAGPLAPAEGQPSPQTATETIPSAGATPQPAGGQDATPTAQPSTAPPAGAPTPAAVFGRWQA